MGGSTDGKVSQLGGLKDADGNLDRTVHGKGHFEKRGGDDVGGAAVRSPRKFIANINAGIADNEERRKRQTWKKSKFDVETYQDLRLRIGECPIAGYKLGPKGLYDISQVRASEDGLVTMSSESLVPPSSSSSSKTSDDTQQKKKSGGWWFFGGGRNENTAAATKADSTEPKGVLLAPKKLVELIEDMEHIEAGYRSRVDIESENTAMGLKRLHFASVLFATFGLVGVYNVREYYRWYTLRAVPSKSLLLKWMIYRNPTIDKERSEYLCRRYRTIFKCTSEMSFMHFSKSFGLVTFMTSCWFYYRPAKGQIHEVRYFGAVKETAVHYSHCESSLKWLYAVFHHHPGYKGFARSQDGLHHRAPFYSRPESTMLEAQTLYPV